MITLYYAISSLLLFGILNIYPIISLNINENELKATLIGTVLILLEQKLLFCSFIGFFYDNLSSILNSLIIIFCFYSKKYKNQTFYKNTSSR